MDMRHSEYRAIRKRHNARELRRIRREMRGAERRLDVRLDPAEALRAANTLGLARKIFGDGQLGGMWVAPFGRWEGEPVQCIDDMAALCDA